MMESLHELFGFVCGQNPDRTWWLAGVPLPFCQRCTGLYTGAATAFILHLVLRPILTNRFLKVHGAFLVFMAPFGFHWVTHGPMIRTITGVLFAFGLVAFLRLPLLAQAPVAGPATQANTRFYMGLALLLILLPIGIQGGGGFMAFVFCFAGLLGFCYLLFLCVANIFAWSAAAWRRLSPMRRVTNDGQA
ncbi:MAG TPA: DUF2085 domain-containing protein [Clostridia bacterium]|nr:DUF2085 domain-containing protein [Clostridia bacterium]